MVFKYVADDPATITGDTLIVFSPSFEKLTDKLLKRLDEGTDGALSTQVESGEFTGKEKQYAVLMHPKGFKVRRVLLVGLGDKKKIDHDTYRRAAGRISGNKGVLKSESVVVYFGAALDAALYQGMMEGWVLGGYRQREFKTGDGAKDPSNVKRMVFVLDNKRSLTKLQKAIERGYTIAEGQVLVRQLAGTPSNYLTPTKYAQKAKALAKKYGFDIRVLDEQAIKREKMGALLSVAQGSAEPPRFMILRHLKGRQGQKPVVLVGKGVTFDTGGISLKPGLDMHEMKGDMAGSAVVLAALVTAARLGLPINLIGLIPCAENMPSGNATRPGDIVTSRQGKTIEIINTDAEGRLLLADGLDYANTFEPEAVIDIATLTGATLYILGYSGAPIMGNNDKLLDRLKQASDATGERVWPLPIWDDMRNQMKSDIADLVNSGGRPAGTIAAAAFLENFVGDWPWAHVDIAYVDVEKKGRPYIPKGTTGFGLRLLIEVLSNWKKL